MTTRQKIFYLLYLPLAVVVAILFSFFASCNTEKRIAQKAIAKMEKADAKYKAKSEVDTAAPHFCNTNYPPRVGKGTVRIIKGDTVTLTGTFTTVQHDTTTNVQTVTKTVVKWHYVHDTAVVRDTLVNTNEITLCKAECDGLRLDNTKAWDEASKAVQAKKKWRSAAYWTWGLIALILAIRIGWGFVRRYIAWKS